MYETKRIEVAAEDGSKVALVVPTSLPTEERAEYLRELFARFVECPTGNWKEGVYAVVPNSLADDVAEAMEFMGAIVDCRHVGTNPDGSNEGQTLLASDGYYAHGF